MAMMMKILVSTASVMMTITSALIPFQYSSTFTKKSTLPPLSSSFLQQYQQYQQQQQQTQWRFVVSSISSSTLYSTPLDDENNDDKTADDFDAKSSATADTTATTTTTSTITTTTTTNIVDDTTNVEQPPVSIVTEGDNNNYSIDVLTELIKKRRQSKDKKLLPIDVIKYENAIDELPEVTNDDVLDVNGGWDLLVLISPNANQGDNVDFFDPNSWKNYVSGKGPSPFQSLITGNAEVDNISQYLTSQDFDNVVDFRLGPLNGKLVLKADAINESGIDNRRTFKFKRGFFILKTIWKSSITLPYPVPFKLLGDRAIGWLETKGYNPKTGLRAAVGNKGTRFIFRKKGMMNSDGNVVVKESVDAISKGTPFDVQLASDLTSFKPKYETNEEERIANANLPKRPIILCPQQFGGKPGDYDEFIHKLRVKGHPVYPARIGALAWLSIVKSAPTKAYIKGELEPSKALPFYMDALNDAVSRCRSSTSSAATTVNTNVERDSDDDNNDATSNNSIDKKEDNLGYTLLSHSIGGWIARAWLGEVATPEIRHDCRNFVSLGTPHSAPPESSWVSGIDQTRGLLKYVNDRWPGAYFAQKENGNIRYTSVASTAVRGGFQSIDSILGYVSYLALVGDGNVEGDGITPVDAAILEGSESIVLDNNKNGKAYHADVLPNPLGRTNAKLVGCRWYGDEIDEWIHAL